MYSFRSFSFFIVFCAAVSRSELVVALTPIYNATTTAPVVKPLPPPGAGVCPKVCTFNTLVACDLPLVDVNGPIYAIADGQCNVYNNFCIYQQMNCERQNNCLCELIQVDRQNCLKHCRPCTSKSIQPICVTFARRTIYEATPSVLRRSFNNRCELARYSCLTNLAYTEVLEGACDQCPA